MGTVSGYRYPHLDAALGARFVRDDGPTADHSLRSDTCHQLRIDLRFDLCINRCQPQCAFSLNSKLDHTRMKQALDSLIDDGSIEKILARYR